MKVLIGVDGSEGSFAAVEMAGQLLSAASDEILLYYGPPQTAVIGSAKSSEKTLERAQQALATAIFDEAKERVPKALLPRVETIIGSGKPAHGLLDTAARQEVELIVVGARGAGPIVGLLLGSVCRTVVHQSTLPVLVARPRSDPSAHDGLRVLLACDSSDASRHAGELLHRFSWAPGSVGQIVTVIETLFAGQLPDWLEKQARDSETEQLSQVWVKEAEADRHRVQAEMTEYCLALPEIFRGQSPIVVEGHASETILATANSERADLVVVGAHSQGPLARLLIGSTSQSLLGHAPCSVLVVPQSPA